MAERIRKSLQFTRESFSLKGAAPKKRENWGGKFDFILSCIGYAVGLGTIWRFPYVCYRNGGGAFLIPYLIYMVLLGMPLVILEMGYGQFSNLSPIAVWKMSPLFQGIGFGMVIISAVVCVYYNVIIAWTLYYFALSFKSPLPWSTCDNEWNTPSCCSQAATNSCAPAYDEWGIKIFRQTPSEQFWENKVLGIREANGIESIGPPRWQLVISLVVAWVFIFLCLCKGVKTSGKVVYVTATLPYVLLVIFLVRGVTLPGALDGIKYYIVPDFSQLLTFKPWAEAAQQLFYSMGAAWGALITMASYNKFTNNFYRDAVIVAFTDTCTAFLVGFVIFSTLGFMALQTGSNIADVVRDGPGLVFVVLPEAIAQMPGSTAWAIIFFIFIFTVGVDSQFGMFETVLSALFDRYPVLRRKKILVTAVLSVIEFVLGLPLITNGGVYVFQIMDWYCSTFSLMVLSLAECLVICWIYGTERFYRDMTLMLGFRPCAWWGICWMAITPFLITFVLLINIVQHTPVTYGSYSYPPWAIGIGWILALCSILPIPVVALVQILTTKHPGSLSQKICALTRPAEDWGPSEPERLEVYQAQDHSKRFSDNCLLAALSKFTRGQANANPSTAIDAQQTTTTSKV